MATLTGAARVALGTEVPPFYTDDDELASSLARCAANENDPLWRMPLWRPYEQLLDSKVADINNVASVNFGGSITAALFLRRFVSRAKLESARKATPRLPSLPPQIPIHLHPPVP